MNEWNDLIRFTTVICSFHFFSLFSLFNNLATVNCRFCHAEHSIKLSYGKIVKEKLLDNLISPFRLQKHLNINYYITILIIADYK